MLNFCMRGFSRAVGLVILAFCTGIIVGAVLPPAAVAVVETIMLIALGYVCLFGR